MLEGRGNRRRLRKAMNPNAGLMLTGEKRIGTDKVSDFRAIPRKIQKSK